MRASVGLVVTEAATGWAATADEYIDRGMDLRDEYQGDPLITTHFAPHAPYSVSRRHAGARASPGGRTRPAGRAAPARDGLGDRAERADVRACARSRASQALGLASPQLVAVHMTQAERRGPRHAGRRRRERRALPRVEPEARRRRLPAARPCSAAASASRSAPTAPHRTTTSTCSARRAPPACCRPASPAAPGSLVASDLLRMATLEGARTLGLGEVTGSLVPGKWADLCCIDLRAARQLAGARRRRPPWSTRHPRSQVTDTWVAGRRLLADGTLRLPRRSRGARSGRRLATSNRFLGRGVCVRMTEHAERRPGGDRTLRRRRPAAGGTRRARCARCTTSIRCGSSTSSARGPLAGRDVLDVGCGGGLLAEAMARKGAQVTGLDLAADCSRSRNCTRSRPGVAVNYRLESAEQHAVEHAGRLRRRDLHGNAGARAGSGSRSSRRSRALVRPGGHVFVSTINRTPRAYAAARSSARSTCCACCRRARTPTRSSSGPRSWRPGRGPPDSARVDIAGLDYDPFSRTRPPRRPTRA